VAGRDVYSTRGTHVALILVQLGLGEVTGMGEVSSPVLLLLGRLRTGLLKS
jgi:hypothetical protein